MKITLVRHATLLVETAGRRRVVDPQLDDQGTRPPIDRTPNSRRNPLVPLPVPAAEVAATSHLCRIRLSIGTCRTSHSWLISSKQDLTSQSRIHFGDALSDSS